MARNRKRAHPNRLRQTVKKGGMGGHALATKPDLMPQAASDGDKAALDHDRRQLAGNQDMSEIEKAEESRSA